MLRNSDLETISKTLTLLTIIKDYILTTKDDSFSKDTGLSADYIQLAIKRLQKISTDARIAKHKASERSNTWNKAHPDQHRKHSRDYARRTYKKEYNSTL